MEQDERDILITMSANVENLTSNFTEFKNDNKKEHDKFNIKLDGVPNKYITSKLFYWLIPFILLFIVGAYGYSTSISSDLTKHQINPTIHVTK